MSSAVAEASMLTLHLGEAFVIHPEEARASARRLIRNPLEVSPLDRHVSTEACPRRRGTGTR